MKATGPKSIHVTITTRQETCPTAHINNVQLTEEDVKDLEINLDKGLTWRKDIFAKTKQLGIILTKMYWLLGHKSELSTNNNLFICKARIKPMWTYATQVWGKASTSKIEIPERFQAKTLRMIMDALWYEPNTKYQQLKKKSTATALNQLQVSPHNQMT
jgi:hypothetical protein